MYKIGEFSKIVDIPVRTLRFYDEYGVLQPSEIDNYTGYRYYTEKDIKECKIIKLLKSVDFTLDEIAIYKNNLNAEILDKKQNEILERINLLKKKYKRLSIIKEEFQKIQNNDSYIPKIYESKGEKILNKKYDRRNIKKSI